jgi:hypothetical protein
VDWRKEARGRQVLLLPSAEGQRGQRELGTQAVVGLEALGAK